MLTITLFEQLDEDGFDARLSDLWAYTLSDDFPDVPGVIFIPTSGSLVLEDAASGDRLTASGNFRNLNDIDALDGSVNSFTVRLDGANVFQIAGFNATLDEFIAAFDSVYDPNSASTAAFEVLFDVAATINGSAGEDFFSGSDADDTFFGGGGADNFDGLGGDDEIRGEAGDDILTGDAGDDMLIGGEGSDTADYSDEFGVNGVLINISNGRFTDSFGDQDTFVSIENVNGTDFDDTIFGNGQNNTFIGGLGADALNGKGGDDNIQGGAGNDVLVGGTGDDVIDGGADNDIIGGRTGDDVIDGGEGDDNIVGQVGDDIINGGGGNDALNGGVGVDTIDGGDGDDIILGRDGNDTLIGGLGDDELNGGTSEDRLIGGAGDDTLIGGAEADTFVYDADSFGNDQVVRFKDGEDIFEISFLASFDDVTVTQVGDDAVLSFGGGTVTVLSLDASLIDESDFMFG